MKDTGMYLKTENWVKNIGILRLPMKVFQKRGHRIFWRQWTYGAMNTDI